MSTDDEGDPPSLPNPLELFGGLHNKGTDLGQRIAQRLIDSEVVKIGTRGNDKDLLQIQRRPFLEAACDVMRFSPCNALDARDLKALEAACCISNCGSKQQHLHWEEGKVLSMTLTESRVASLDAASIGAALHKYAGKVVQALTTSTQEAIDRSIGR